MTLAQVAHAVLEAALAVAGGAPVALSIRGRRIDVVVADHRVVVDVRRGVLRVVWVVAPVANGPATRDLRVALDDADEAVVAAMVKGAIEEGLQPF